MARPLGSRWYRLLVTCAALVCIGCQREARTSLHESDHVVPPHWPSDLADLVAKVDHRVSLLQRQLDAAAMKELADLIGWAPEIAADSELSEGQWLPVYEASLALSDRLHGRSAGLDERDFKQLELFRVLLASRAAMAETNSPQRFSDVEPTADQEHSE